METIRNAEPVFQELESPAVAPRRLIGTKFLDIGRHVVAILLLYLARISLSRFYLDHHDFQMWIFLLQLCGAVVIGALPILRDHLRNQQLPRLLLVSLIVFLAIPWGEMLRLNFAVARENWAHQLWTQTVFTYSVLLSFKILPALPQFLANRTAVLIKRLASNKISLFLPAVLLFILSSWICVTIYNQTPVVNDSSSYLFQAKIFKAGHLYAPVPPVADFFSYDNDMLVIKDGKWFSMYPPGFAFLLALAMFIKAEWFLAPLLGAFTLAIWTEFARKWHGPRTAFLLGCLCLFSPFIFQMSSTMIIHSPELFLASAILYLCRRQTEGPTLSRNVLLLLLLALAILLRPFSLLIFLSPILAYTCWEMMKQRNFSVPVMLAAGITLGTIVLCLFQWQTVGSPWTSAYSVEFKGLKYGFGTNYAAQIHTPLRGLELISNNILGMNHWLTGWYSGSLFLICAFFVTGKKLEIWDRLLLCSAAAIIVFYFGYFFQDLIFGPRFFYLLAPFLLLLIARAADMDRMATPNRTITAFLVVSLFSFFLVRFPEFLRIYNPSNDPPEYFTKKIEKLGKVLVFLEPQVSQDYVNWNDPFLNGNRIICRDLGQRNTQALTAFPQYQPFYFRFATLSFHANEGEENYGFYPNRGPANSEISFFELALTLEAGNEFPDKDCFDLTYPRLLSLRGAQRQIEFLQMELTKIGAEQDGYKKNFRSGLVRCANMLLLPKLAFEKNPTRWWDQLDRDAFRTELKTSKNYFAAAGETGKSLLKQIEKVERRIDQNEDHVLSDNEMSRYLSEKILYLVKY